MLPAQTTEVRLQTPSIDLDRWGSDFIGFAALLDVIDKGGQRVKLRPNAIQTAFEVSRGARDIVLKPRQVGLTTWELARDIWFFLTRPGARVVVVCQSDKDDSAVKEISGKLATMFDALKAELGLAFPVRANSATQWTLPGRDASLRIVGAGASEASAQKKGRSGTIHRLHITELAYFEHAAATLNAMLECVPSPEFGSEVTIESTANGLGGVFYDRYQSAKAGRSAYKAHFFRWMDQKEYASPVLPGETVAPANDNERELELAKLGASPEQLKWYRQKVADKGQDLTDQEYPIDEETCWLVAGRLYFDVKRTRQLLARCVEPLEVRPIGREDSFGVLRVFRRAEAEERFLIICDPSEGVGNHPAGAVVLARATGEHVATIHGQFKTWEMARVLVEVAREYNLAKLVVERNNHGVAVLQALVREQHYPKTLIYQSKNHKELGWWSSEVSRAAALESLHDAHREGRWTTPDRLVVGEFLRFIVNKKGRAEAASGGAANDGGDGGGIPHGELVICMAIGQDVLSSPNAMLAALQQRAG